MTNILAVKTISAEEVIAKVEEETDEHYILSSARVLVMQQDQKGQVSLGMLPYMASANNPEFASESNIKLYKKDIISEVVSVPEPLKKAYLQQVSGIELI